MLAPSGRWPKLPATLAARSATSARTVPVRIRFISRAMSHFKTSASRTSRGGRVEKGGQFVAISNHGVGVIRGACGVEPHAAVVDHRKGCAGQFLGQGGGLGGTRELGIKVGQDGLGPTDFPIPHRPTNIGHGHPAMIHRGRSDRAPFQSRGNPFQRRGDAGLKNHGDPRRGLGSAVGSEAVRDASRLSVMPVAGCDDVRMGKESTLYYTVLSGT